MSQTVPSSLPNGELDVDLLRFAAEKMRAEHPKSHPRHDMWVALAELFEEHARALFQGPEATTEHDLGPVAVYAAEAYLSAQRGL